MIIDLPDIDLFGFVADADRAQRVERYRKDRVAAHAELFVKRHPLPACEAQQIAIGVFHDAHPRTILKAFRGFAKSTMGEEGLLLKAGMREISYGIILGNTYGMAVKRLASIKSEINRNRDLAHLFCGDRLQFIEHQRNRLIT